MKECVSNYPAPFIGESRQGVDYRLRLSDFVPWAGLAEYDNRTGNDIIGDSKNAGKIKRRGILLASYNLAIVVASSFAISFGATTGLKSLEEFLK